MALEKWKSKARSTAAQWYAQVKKLEAELTGAKAKLRALQAGDAVVDKAADVPVVGEYTEWLQQQMDAFVAEASADVQRIEAELLVARGRLRTARAAKDAVDAVSETMADVARSVGDVAEELSDGAQDRLRS